ncbi:MAG: D-alanyl-D-alanine carboxypeptidase, partial [Ilumatobacteraceae bacterium]
GITRVTGGIVGDESRYDQVRRAPGWLDWEMPLPGGSISALMVNSNSRIGEQAYLADPTQHNVDLLATALVDAGIQVDGTSGPGSLPETAEPLFTYPSASVAELVGETMRESDNMTAEVLNKEIGLQVSGEPSIEAGLAASVDALEESLCVEIDGLNDDASGISRDNRRSAGSWQDLLVAAMGADWFDTFYANMPVSGAEDGTLSGRFLGTVAEGDVRAKTGTIGTAVALSGYLETDGGRLAAFSVVANGSDPEPAVPAIDSLVVALAADTG